MTGQALARTRALRLVPLAYCISASSSPILLSEPPFLPPPVVQALAKKKEDLQILLQQAENRMVSLGSDSWTSCLFLHLELKNRCTRLEALVRASAPTVALASMRSFSPLLIACLMC